MSDLAYPREGKHIFVAGEWIELEGVDSTPSISPTTEEVVGHIAAARSQDIESAVEAIRPHLSTWRDLSSTQRATYLRKFAQRLDQCTNELIEIEIEDSGLTRRTATRDVQGAINSLILCASYATEIKGNTYSATSGTSAFTEREPYGIVARIIAFNHPISFAVQAIGATAIVGNSVIVKPPEQCSLSSLMLAELARGVFPPGVVNVITGYGHEAGAALVTHPEIPRIGFTGSVPTGRKILEGAAPYVKHVTLELGGKNPLIITSDADVEFAAKVALSGMNFNQAGQSCQSTTRLLIHVDRYERVLGRLEEYLHDLVIGDPRDEATDMGPLAYKAHYDRVLNYIAIGIDEGATLRAGGKRPEGFAKGYYIEPTLFSNVSADMRVVKEEIFGPVVCAMPWDDREEVIRLANDTEFGLNSRVVAGTVDEGMAIARKITAGTSLVNTASGRAPGMPFGGFKQSGLGKQSCLEEVLSYTQEKTYVVGL